MIILWNCSQIRGIWSLLVKKWLLFEDKLSTKIRWDWSVNYFKSRKNYGIGHSISRILKLPSYHSNCKSLILGVRSPALMAFLVAIWCVKRMAAMKTTHGVILLHSLMTAFNLNIRPFTTFPSNKVKFDWRTIDSVNNTCILEELAKQEIIFSCNYLV